MIRAKWSSRIEATAFAACLFAILFLFGACGNDDDSSDSLDVQQPSSVAQYTQVEPVLVLDDDTRVYCIANPDGKGVTVIYSKQSSGVGITINKEDACPTRR